MNTIQPNLDLIEQYKYAYGPINGNLTAIYSLYRNPKEDKTIYITRESDNKYLEKFKIGNDAFEKHVDNEHIHLNRTKLLFRPEYIKVYTYANTPKDRRTSDEFPVDVEYIKDKTLSIQVGKDYAAVYITPFKELHVYSMKDGKPDYSSMIERVNSYPTHITVDNIGEGITVTKPGKPESIYEYSEVSSIFELQRYRCSRISIPGEGVFTVSHDKYGVVSSITDIDNNEYVWYDEYTDMYGNHHISSIGISTISKNFDNFKYPFKKLIDMTGYTILEDGSINYEKKIYSANVDFKAVRK